MGRQQVEALEDETQLTIPNPRPLRLRQTSDLFSIQQVLAAAGGIEAAEDVHEGGLTRTGRPHHGDVVAGIDPQADASERVDRLPGHTVLLGKVDRFQNSAHVPAPPAAGRRPTTTCCPSVSVPPVISVNVVSRYADGDRHRRECPLGSKHIHLALTAALGRGGGGRRVEAQCCGGDAQHVAMFRHLDIDRGRHAGI